MTVPPYRPPDHLAQVLEQLQAAKALTAHLVAMNESSSDGPSERIAITAETLEYLVNSVAIMAQLQRQMQSDLADAAVYHYERSLSAANQMMAYTDTQTLIGRAMRQAEDATDGFTASQGLRKALSYVVGLVDSIMVTLRHVRATIAQFDALAATVTKLRSDVAPLIERERERQAQLDNWLDDALKGGTDDKGE